jgi:hypothetical protein
MTEDECTAFNRQLDRAEHLLDVCRINHPEMSDREIMRMLFELQLLRMIRQLEEEGVIDGCQL